MGDFLPPIFHMEWPNSMWIPPFHMESSTRRLESMWTVDSTRNDGFQVESSMTNVRIIAIIV